MNILIIDLIWYTNNSSKVCVLEVDLEYPKELRELHNGYPLAADEIEIKREIWSECQLKLADLCNIPICNVKKLVPKLFDKEKYVIHYENLQLNLRLELKIHHVLEFNQCHWLKLYFGFNTQKRIEVEKMTTKIEKHCTN